MAENSNDNGRQDFRINDVIPLSEDRLTAEEFEVNKTKVGVRSRQNGMLRQMVGRDLFSGEQNQVNPEMSQAIEALDAKLNYLIGVNMLNDASHGNMQERPVNLSVTGISFVTDKHYKLGDAVAINLMLPLFPPSILELVGTVVRAPRPKGTKQQVGIKFYYRCDDEEDTISKYVYRRHRETIRAENKNR
ncbi:PilZ domain-containing protein [Mariprofundus sp. EBB-1]|uniref:PilZ domain-containing protein n=1 Tax=Mariprofundus sp. EBB-1 TaxID=2650971 RepID=UPI000EF23098|nr:PilZ domain-containing protein [Mariprofundus sp. EBB-1]RLL53019.1 PilZ domain-containing protein [Mariprofundus sp. EBB-1]